MYIPSPMPEYNRNNPFVILLKKEYNNITDMLFKLSKISVIVFIILTILIIINAIMTILIFLKTDLLIRQLCILVLITFLSILQLYNFSYIIKKYSTTHPAMVHFENISSKLLNDILSMNEEDLLLCLHKMYEMKGELQIRISNMRFLYRFSIFCQGAYTVFILYKILFNN